MQGVVELLKQNLTIDPDLRNFINFALESVSELGGNVFAAAVTSLDLIEKLRSAGAGNGLPMQVSLLLQGNHLLVLWDENKKTRIATLKHLPSLGQISQLCSRLHRSTVLTDPNILLQRNAEMERHFAEVKARTEQAIEDMQHVLNKRQHELFQVSLQAETDSLTGLLNRRSFDEKLKQAFLHTMRQRNSPLSLLFFDLDHFKDINDEFGHQVGDEHLNKTADILRSIIREDVDFAFRFGGDEFAVVLFADYTMACDKARQVLNAMDHKISIGIATIDQDTQDDLTLEEFVRRADSALYEAKHRGRGQVVSHFCMTRPEQPCPFPCKDNNNLTICEHV